MERIRTITVHVATTSRICLGKGCSEQTTRGGPGEFNSRYGRGNWFLFRGMKGQSWRAVGRSYVDEAMLVIDRHRLGRWRRGANGGGGGEGGSTGNPLAITLTVTGTAN